MLLQHRLLAGADSPSVITYATPVVGALYTLVEHHIVQGGVVFPAAGYLEMAAAGVMDCHAPSSGLSSLSLIRFLRPCSLNEQEDSRLLLEVDATAQRFEIRLGGFIHKPVAVIVPSIAQWPIDIHLQTGQQLGREQTLID